ncbi:MAG TPA: hypothetical protein VFN91_05600 [Myxococcaceae bacterium]|nr:hypothetical protein [Myxococcaceae bacterium]
MRTSGLLLTLALVAPTAAWATPDFPAAIARDLQLSAPPACTICHATDAGGSGTVTKPFGKYLVSRGLVPFDENSLAGALAAAAGENHDSNGDGISDIQALKMGLDPNGTASGASTLEDPTFGCGAARGGGGGTWIGVLLVGLGLAAARGWRTARACPSVSEPRSSPRTSA